MSELALEFSQVGLGLALLLVAIIIGLKEIKWALDRITKAQGKEQK